MIDWQLCSYNLHSPLNFDAIAAYLTGSKLQILVFLSFTFVEKVNLKRKVDLFYEVRT